MYGFYYYSKNYEYPENLYRTILESEEDVESYTSDIGERLIDILENDGAFNDRSRDVFKLYFVDKFTLKEISGVYEITQERVRQILLKDLRKLRMKIRVNYMKYGKEYNRQIKNFKFVDFDITPTFWTVNGVSMDFVKHDKMSVRIEKALIRKGFKTFDEILKLSSRRDFYGIRNIGEASIDKIIEHFEYLGINVDRFKK